MLVDAGWEVGSHTRTHPRLPELTGAELASELQGSRRDCEHHLGLPCRSIAYPYGAVDERVADAVAKAGYSFAAELPGSFRMPLESLRWPRVGLYHRDAPWRFRLKTARLTRALRGTPAWGVLDRTRHVGAPWSSGDWKCSLPMTSSHRGALVDDAMRLGVYTDYQYRRDATGVYAQKAFTLFIARLADEFDGLTLLGRVDPRPGRWHYRLPDSISFVALPWYRTLAEPLQALPAMLRSVRRFWRALDGVDFVWLLGPHLLSIAFLDRDPAKKTRHTGHPPGPSRYVASRHPGRRTLRALALILEGAWRMLARQHPIVVVGPDLERRYRDAMRRWHLRLPGRGVRDRGGLRDS